MSQDPRDRRGRMNSEGDGEHYSGEPLSKLGLNLNSIIPIVIAVVLSMVLVYFFFSPMDKASATVLDTKITEAKTEFAKTLTDTVAPFKTLKTDLVKSNTDQINSAIAGMPTTQQITDIKNLATQAQTASDNAQKVAAQAQSDATKAQQTATQAQGSATALQNDVNGLKTSVNNIQSQVGSNTQVNSKVATLESNVATLMAERDTLKAQYEALKTRVDDYIDDGGSATPVPTGDLVVKPIGTRLILSNIFNNYPSSDSNYIPFQFRITNKSTKDITVYELKLNLARYKYNGSSDLEDYDIQISPDKFFTTGKVAFILDDSTSGKLVYTSTGTYDVDANDSRDITVYVRALLNSSYVEYDAALAPYYLRLTPTLSVIDFDSNE